MDVHTEAEVTSMDGPLVEFTDDLGNPDASYPLHSIHGDSPFARWGNALIHAAARRTDLEGWKFNAKPGERFVITLEAGSVEGELADVSDETALVLIDAQTRHTIPWDAIRDVATTGSPVCA